MRKHAGLHIRRRVLSLFVVFLAISTLSIVVSSRPYWATPGTYFEYTARGDRAVIIECHNGTLYFGTYGVLRWEILDVARDQIELKVQLRVYNLTMHYQRALNAEEGLIKARELIEMYSSLNFTQSGPCRVAEVQAGRVKVCERADGVLIAIEETNQTYWLYAGDNGATEGLFSNATIPNLSRSITFNVSLTDNSVLHNGKRLGMNTLFLTDLDVAGRTIMNGWFINEVRELNATVHTRFGAFKPPIVLVTTNFYGNSSNFALYDPGSGVLIEGYTPVSPIWELFGFKRVLFSDREHFNRTDDPIIKSKDIYGFGMVLEDTNAFYSETGMLENVQIPLDAIAVFVLAITVFLVIGYERAKTRRMGKQ